MTDRDLPRKEAGRRWPGFLFAFGLGAIGLLMAHHPMLLSGLEQVQVDLGDSRLINYLLEHNYQWYRGSPLHRDFWNPLFFYPARNIAAYSDTMLGIAPLYAVFRIMGFAPDTSFQLWMLAISILNYGVMLHFASRRLGLSIVAASGSAFLFAFGSPRINMLIQQPQLPQFLSLVAIDALFGLFSDRNGPWFRRLGLWVLASLGMFAQLSSGFYTGWFTVFSLGIAALVAFGMATTRVAFVTTLWRDAPWIAIAAVIGGVPARPWFIHHLAASRLLGMRYYPYVSLALPHPSTWLYVGTQNWFGGLTTRLSGFAWFKASVHDFSLGVGLCTTVLALWGLLMGRGRASTWIFVAVAIALLTCVTKLPFSLVFAVEYLFILGSAAFAYVQREEQPGTFFLVIGAFLLLLSLRVSPSEPLVGAGFAIWFLAVSAFIRWDDGWGGRVLLGGLMLAFTYALFPSLLVLGLGALFGAIAAVVMLRVGHRSWPMVATPAFGVFFLYVSITTYLTQPLPFVMSLTGPVLVFLARRSPGPPPRLSFLGVMILGCLMERLFEGSGSAWTFIFNYVPGAGSMLFVSRVGLMMLIPAAIGFGYFLDRLLARKRLILAMVLGLVCLLEQGVTTGSYDKAANRAVVTALSKRVDREAEAFYYSPRDSPYPPFKANLDAMWSGLATDKPTLNGYSGHTPVGFRDLEDSNETGSIDHIRLRQALDHWRRQAGRNVRSVQWIEESPDALQ